MRKGLVAGMGLGAHGVDCVGGVGGGDLGVVGGEGEGGEEEEEGEGNVHGRAGLGWEVEVVDGLEC